ncbi:hypothetical protein [Coralliovum pocilloporae]|uniref:hypothetical protein n=1 Tax=Coralliovum pocilloporae TaxID=3066369 RepID=UPI0033070074
MIQLLPAALIGAAGYLAYKAVRKEMKRVGDEIREADRKANHIPTLERDPETGIYRPRDDGS